MTTKEIKEILNGTFADVADREYWERKLREQELKEQRALENKRYYRINAVYAR